jgi:cell wall-associated NlpC family hydrolase
MTRRALGAVALAAVVMAMLAVGVHHARVQQVAERSHPQTLPAIHGKGAPHPRAAKIALRYLGVPYVWGGASPSGFDASGLVTYVYKQLGISLPHYTVSQWAVTKPILRKRLKPGDLVFFDNLEHVGIYIGHDEFVHAPHTGAVVRIENLAPWLPRLDGARRVP